MNIRIFQGISAEEKKNMVECFGAVTRSYVKGERAMHMSAELNRVGVLKSGRMHISCVNFDGRVSVIEHLEKGDVFGEMFTLPMGDFEYFAEADTECEVLYMDYGAIVKPCVNACKCHQKILDNLFRIAAVKSQNLALHINILSQRTIREKLRTYVETQSILESKNTVVLPVSFTALADYLCVDRSAMMREIKHMKKDGILAVNGREITLYP